MAKSLIREIVHVGVEPKKLVALAGIEGACHQFSTVHLSLAGTGYAEDEHVAVACGGLNIRSCPSLDRDDLIADVDA